MKRDLVEVLACPACRRPLVLRNAAEADGEIESGSLHCEACARDYPIVRFIPRFVPAENYADSFGFQWNRFPKTQLDSYSGVPITRDRFFGMTGWSPESMRGAWVLDVGCGSGRFAEVALSTGARVVALDYSSAIDAARDNLRANPNAYFVQASVYELPFRPAAFDAVYCLGVLQHTPDVKRAFVSLFAPLRDGGRIAVDMYPKFLTNIFWPKYWFRPFTRHMDRERLFAFVERLVDRLLPLSSAVARIPLIGRKLRYLVPIVNYDGVYPLDARQRREWAVLDTFDMYSPAHDHPQSAATLRAWLAEAHVRDGEVFRHGHYVARGTKSSS